MNKSRRIFMMQSVAVGLSLALAKFALAAEMVNEKDKQAISLGYVSDTKKVDKAKYPKHAETQHCSNCMFYQGKEGDKAGACPLFPGKEVAAIAWCGSYTAKAKVG